MLKNFFLVKKIIILFINTLKHKYCKQNKL